MHIKLIDYELLILPLSPFKLLVVLVFLNIEPTSVSLSCFIEIFVFSLQLYDIRSMKELESFRGHTKDITGQWTFVMLSISCHS